MENIFNGIYVKIFDFDGFNSNYFLLLVNERGNTQSFDYESSSFSLYDVVRAFIYLLDECVTDDKEKQTETLNFNNFIKDNFDDYEWFKDDIIKILNIEG